VSYVLIRLVLLLILCSCISQVFGDLLLYVFFFSDVIKKIKLEKALSRKIFLIVFGMDLHYSMVARALRCLGNKKLGSRYKKVLMEMERGWLFYSLTACFYDRKDKRGGSHEVSCPYRVINAKRF